MRNVCWALIGLAVLAFLLGTYLTLRNSMFLTTPGGYWRGAVGFLLFAISLRLMEMPAGVRQQAANLSHPEGTK